MAASALENPSRRALFRGRSTGPSPLRPPWALAEDEFISRCTRCDACIDACPESILSRGDGGFPTVDFTRGECTFCQACADACVPHALSSGLRAPWAIRANVDDSCLALRGVHCQTCRDACPHDAIRFPMRSGVPRPLVEAAACTGCGACVAPCPVAAISVKPPVAEACA